MHGRQSGETGACGSSTTKITPLSLSEHRKEQGESRAWSQAVGLTSSSEVIFQQEKSHGSCSSSSRRGAEGTPREPRSAWPDGWAWLQASSHPQAWVSSMWLTGEALQIKFIKTSNPYFRNSQVLWSKDEEEPSLARFLPR